MPTASNEYWTWERDKRRKGLVSRKEALTPRLRDGLPFPFPPEIEKLSKEVVSTAVLGKNPNEGGGRIYLLEFRGPGQPGQYVKLGSVIDNYRRRVLQHRRIARVHGFALVDAWISDQVPDPTKLESALRNLLRISHREHDGEYFLNSDIDKAASLAAATVEAWRTQLAGPAPEQGGAQAPDVGGRLGLDVSAGGGGEDRGGDLGGGGVGERAAVGDARHSAAAASLSVADGSLPA
ncbi:GIY-YIG nuclease family protein [Streptomyces angustmyceticus]|uniref:GIY-YIG nuclease family protein n=1 Tax=Streptomyces angustmyceticus TaxID=285578 RepID=UPI003D8A7D3A